MPERGYKYESSARQNLRAELESTMHRIPDSGYAKNAAAYGVELSLDLDSLGEAIMHLGDIDLRRYPGADNQNVKDAIRSALEDLCSLQRQLFERYWAAGE